MDSQPPILPLPPPPHPTTQGYQGQCNGALTEALRRVPDAVVILDEFEKAHPSFLDACFLNVFGADGFFLDSCADNKRVCGWVDGLGGMEGS